VFFEPSRSQFDLNFRIFGIDVRIHPMFWLVSVIMGWYSLDLGFEFLLIWIICVFVSILIHELGHVFAGMLFGSHGHIVLYSFGGLAIGSSALRRRWQRIVVYFAGPLAGFLLAGLTILVARRIDPEEIPPLLLITFEDLLWINIFWGLLNLLPVWPLDGGQISRDFLEGVQPNGGTRTSLGISLVVAGLLAFIAVVNTNRRLPIGGAIPYLGVYLANLKGWFIVIFFAAFALNSYQLLQAESGRQPWDRDGDYWGR
jgi:stage IV sporulation protein FB